MVSRLLSGQFHRGISSNHGSHRGVQKDDERQSQGEIGGGDDSIPTSLFIAVGVIVVMGGDGMKNESQREREAKTEAGPNWSVVNWAVIALFSGLTLVGVVLSIGVFEPVVSTSGGSDTSAVAVPLYVYLYAGLGALGYVFTKLMADLDQYTEWSKLEQLAAMGMRIPAALILAAGIYLFLGDFSGAAENGDRFAAGVAFLVGLYVNVALKALGSLADRILGRPTKTES
jgi:Na+/H+ antiporter NhaC